MTCRAKSPAVQCRHYLIIPAGMYGSRRGLGAESSRPKYRPFSHPRIFPPTLNPLPQWRERAKSLPVPRGNTATAGTRRHLCSAMRFSTQPTEPGMKEGKVGGKRIYRRRRPGCASSRNGGSCEVHRRDCDLACRSLASDAELDGIGEVADCRTDRRNDC